VNDSDAPDLSALHSFALLPLVFLVFRSLENEWKRPLGAQKTLLIETNRHAVKRLKSESAAGGWGIPPDPHGPFGTEEIET
jgi:hypothetical protein